MTAFADHEAKRIRYLLLRILAAQEGKSSTLYMLTLELRRLGYRKSDEYVLNQLHWLEREALAVTIIAAGDGAIARLRSAGRRHVEGEALLEGVGPPDEEA